VSEQLCEAELPAQVEPQQEGRLKKWKTVGKGLYITVPCV